MTVAVVDSNVLIDYENTGAGDRHDRAEGIVRGMDTDELPTGRVTNYILLETLNWIHERQRHDIAVDLHRRLADSAGFELIHRAQKDFPRAVDLFETYEGSRSAIQSSPRTCSARASSTSTASTTISLRSTG